MAATKQMHAQNFVFELTLMYQQKLSEPIGENTEEGDENLSHINLMDRVPKLWCNTDNGTSLLGHLLSMLQ